MELIKKDVRYLNKDFAQFRQNLINFTRQYFPNTYNDFNESSPGMLFIEMASFVGDVLSYYTDQSFRESVFGNGIHVLEGPAVVTDLDHQHIGGEKHADPRSGPVEEPSSENGEGCGDACLLRKELVAQIIRPQY